MSGNHSTSGARSVGVIVGLRSEAACLARGVDRSLVRIAGARPAAAAAMAKQLVEAGCAGLVSFGTAGGLDPDLDPGTLLIAEAVSLPDGDVLRTDADWSARITAAAEAAVPGTVSGIVAGATAPLLGAQVKRFCRHASGAVAVDMESGAVAKAATAAGVPFVVVRAITDPADRSIPAWVADLVTEDGRTPISAALRGLLQHPSDLGLMIRLGRDARAAMRALRRVALAAGPLFHFDG